MDVIKEYRGERWAWRRNILHVNPSRKKLKTSIGKCFQNWLRSNGSLTNQLSNSSNESDNSISRMIDDRIVGYFNRSLIWQFAGPKDRCFNTFRQWISSIRTQETLVVKIIKKHTLYIYIGFLIRLERSKEKWKFGKLIWYFFFTI